MAVNAPSISPEDSSLQLKVKVELRINPKTELLARKINTSARRRVVTLEGQVGSELDVRNAERVVLGVPGVATVDNRLTVA
jgi:osmotically-inducible protein OsmY